MSVINQMLKDLEQRAPEQGQAPVPVIQNQRTSITKIIAMSVIALLAINVLGFYIWDLNNRVTSSELKASQLQKKAESKIIAVEQKRSDEEPAKASANVEKKSLEIVQSAEQAKSSEQSETLVATKNQQVAQINAETKTNSSITESTSSVLTKNSVQSKAVQDAPIQSKQPKIVKPASNVDAKPSKMTVSRRQLTPSELVDQKLSKAEKAINANQIAKAEKLFEEVLIIEANNKEARKKLAALWFGRKSYQQAVNLLSQGISLDKQDSELRLLKAKIQLQQGQHEAAYQTLRPLAHLEQQDYQVMLANVAQQIQAYESAINAYKLLIKMQPYSGKWHLGIAIIYDKNSQFILAEQAYAKALSKHDLSKASAEFAQQRMQALGE